MRVLLVNKYFYLKGGSETLFFKTAKLLTRGGHEVMFFSMQHPRNFQSPYEKYFVSNVNYENHSIKNIVKSSSRILYAHDARRKIEELMHSQKPTLAHLHSIFHQISPSIIHSLKKFNIPIVMTLHDYKMVCASYFMLYNGKICEACKQGKYYHCFLKGCVKNSRMKSLLNLAEMYLHHKILRIYELADVFISPSRFLKFKLQEMGFKKKIIYLPNFVRAEDFEPCYNWKDNSIVYFGRLSKEKGLFTLIEAIKGLDVKLKIIGEGPIEDDLVRTLRSANCTNVELLGYKSGEELKDEIRKSMFTVVPSEWYEVFGLVIIEAFALGKPVIGAHIGGIPELVKNNKTGLLFNPRNTKELRSKIVQLLKNPNEIGRMGRNARKFIETELNEKNHYEKLMEIYKSVLK